MRTKLTAAVAIAAMFVILLAPAVSDSEAVYSNISGDSVVGTSDSVTYTVVYTNHDYDGYTDMSMSISYAAKLTDSSGSTVSSAVSSSSGSLTNGEAMELTVTAPSSTGAYTLVVTYTVEVTYTDEEGETVTVDSETLAREDSYSIKVVSPITLSVTLSNDSNVDLSGFGVYFYIDGEKIDDSYTTIDLAQSGTATVSYEWIADPGKGTYTYYVLPADSGNLVEITGLGTEYTFYVGDNSYTLWEALVIVVIILLALIMIWVYRKPVKNYGKPKSRR